MPFTDPGSFCWFELGTTDQAAAKRYYHSLFGWEIDDTPMGPEETYTTFRSHGKPAAAAYNLRADDRTRDVPAHWMIYVSVTSADDKASRAESLGATIIAPPFDVMEYGRMAVLQDPTGAMFSIWQNGTHHGAGVWGTPGAASWGDLNTPDQARAAEFYTRLFGWRMVGAEMRDAQPGEYFHVMNGQDMIGGIAGPAQRNPNAPPHWLIYFETAGCKAATDKAKSLGGRAYVENMKIGESGYSSVIADPQGATFGLHSRHA